MKKNFRVILEKVLEYEQRQCVIVIILLVAALLTIGVFAIKRSKSAKLVDKIIIGTILLGLVATAAAYFIHYSNYRQKIMTDINKEEFIEFHGEFTHDDYQKDSFYHNVYLMDDGGNEILLRYPDYANMHDTYKDFTELPVGSFAGTVIYSKNSKIVVGWYIEEFQSDAH